MPQKHRLLVLEDEKNMSDVICRVAGAAGFKAHGIRYFDEIPTFYNIFVPHVIVLDIFMPDLNGFAVLEFLHRHNSTSRIVLISGDNYSLERASRMARSQGLSVAAVVPKPFSVEQLREILENIQASLLESSGGTVGRTSSVSKQGAIQSRLQTLPKI